MNIYIILAFTAGLLLALQVGVNATVANSIHSSYMAVLLSFSVGTLSLIAYALTSKQTFFISMSHMQNIPWWGWSGGLLGAAYVTLAIVSAPQVGAAQMVAFIVAGQLLTSLILDHFGLVGFEVNQINLYRVIGAIFLITGVFLIRKS